MPANRLTGAFNRLNPHDAQKFTTWSLAEHALTFTTHLCSYRDFFQTEAGERAEHGPEVRDWTKLAEQLMDRLSFENRIFAAEKQLKDVSDRLTHLEALCERAIQKPVCVPISTFAPEPFEVIRDFSVVVQPEEDCHVATLFDANISSSGETQEEAVANVKDLILMIFKDFESEDDSELGPAMIRQKHALSSLIRRK